MKKKNSWRKQCTAKNKKKKKQVPLFHSAHAVCCLKQKRNRFFYWKIELLRVVDGWRSRRQEERNIRTYVAHAFSFRFFFFFSSSSFSRDGFKVTSRRR